MGRRGLDLAIDALDDGLAIDGVGEGLAHIDVVEGRAMRVEEDIVGADQTGAQVVGLQLGVALDGGEIGW